MSVNEFQPLQIAQPLYSCNAVETFGKCKYYMCSSQEVFSCINSYIRLEKQQFKVQVIAVCYSRKLVTVVNVNNNNLK